MAQKLKKKVEYEPEKLRDSQHVQFTESANDTWDQTKLDLGQIKAATLRLNTEPCNNENKNTLNRTSIITFGRTSNLQRQSRDFDPNSKYKISNEVFTKQCNDEPKYSSELFQILEQLKIANEQLDVQKQYNYELQSELSQILGYLDKLNYELSQNGNDQSVQKRTHESYQQSNVFFKATLEGIEVEIDKLHAKINTIESDNLKNNFVLVTRKRSLNKVENQMINTLERIESIKGQIEEINIELNFKTEKSLITSRKTYHELCKSNTSSIISKYLQDTSSFIEISQIRRMFYIFSKVENGIKKEAFYDLARSLSVSKIKSQKNELNYAFDSNCLPQKHSSEIEQRLLALRVVIKRKILEQKMIQRAEIKTCFVLWVEFTQRITDKDIKLKRLIKIVQNNSVLRDAFKIIQTGLLKMPEFLFSSDGVNEILDSSNSYNIKECNKMEKVYSNHKYWVEKRGYFHQLRTNVKKRRFGTLLLQLKVFTGWKQFWIRSRSIQNQEFFQDKH